MVQFDEKVYGSSMKRLEALFDAGTFVELGAYTKRADSETDYESVVCGYGAVGGRLVFAFAQDSSRTCGAFGEGHAKKIADTYALAIKNGAPIVGVFDSLGASVYEASSACAAYGKLMKCISRASGIIPQIAVIGGVCGGSAAVAASMFDFCVTVKGQSELFVNAPFVLGGANAAEGFSAASGACCAEAEDEAQAFAYVSSLLSLLPQNNADSCVEPTADDLNRLLSLDPEQYTAEALAAALVDNSSFIRIYEAYSKGALVGFGRIGGVSAGLVISDPSADGVLDIPTCRAISRLVSFCDSFHIPVVTLVDSVGVAVCAETERAAYAAELASLAMAYGTSECAKVSAVIGKAYGAAFALLGSKALGADMAFALPSACIGVLSPEACVAFVQNDQVGEKSREELEAEWRETCASSKLAADRGDVDDVIAPAELRRRICAALSMLTCKADGEPVRRHAVQPL